VTNVAQGWLDIQCQTIDGVDCGVLLLIDTESGAFKPIAQCPVNTKEPTELIPIARIALDQRQPAVNQRIGNNDTQDTSFDYVALPIFTESVLIGVIAVKMQHRPEDKQQEVTHRLETGLKWLALAQLQQQASSTDFYAKVVKLVASCFEQQTFAAAANALVNQLATALQFERVSFGILKDQHCEVMALSNSAQFDSRSNLIDAVADAMDEAVEQDTILLFPYDSKEFESYVTRAHVELVRKFGTGSVGTIPLIHDGTIFGAITLERTEEQPFEADMVRLCEQCSALVAPFLDLKKREEMLLLEKIWDTFKAKTSGIFGLKQFGLKLSALIVAAVLVFASLTNGEFQVHADAVLEGKIQRVVAVSIDGFVATSNFRSGDTVTKGDILATLDAKDLELEWLKLSSERQKFKREYREAMAESDRVQVRVSSAQIAQADAEIDLIREQLARTNIVAPFDGIIIDGDLSQSLGSPVERGDTLFKVAPLEGYRIVLKVDERDIAYIEKGQSGTLSLSSLPGKHLPLVVEKITAVANTEEGYNAFRVEAGLADASVVLRPGMEGVGKIDAGEANILWIWTHELVDWLRLWVWSWWP